MTLYKETLIVTKEGDLYFVGDGKISSCAETLTEAFRLFGELVEKSL